MPKRSPTTKDAALLHQLHRSGQLTLAAEFQRNAVWPQPAKAYLIDTIINDRPIPLLFFQRTTSAQTGLSNYIVIDGQQRLRTIFDYLDDRFPLARSKKSSYSNKRFSELDSDLQEQIRNYDFVVEELSGYSENDIRDMFVRINRYVVQLSPQEMRHAKGQGKFHDFVERLGRIDFWKQVFSNLSLRRMRAVEFVAELTILLIEGPQDKKTSVELYYGRYKYSFRAAKDIEKRIRLYLAWIKRALPDFGKTRYRKSVDLYALMGAVDRASNHGTQLTRLSPSAAGHRLLDFDRKTRAKDPTGEVARYLAAASRQTDNIVPRTTRIGILDGVVRGQ